MRRFSLLTLTLLLFTTLASAQKIKNSYTGNDGFSIKTQAFMGFYIDQSTNLENIHPACPTGFNLGIEFKSYQQQPWLQYHNNPTYGFGLSYIDFGAPDVMGHAIALYPYINLNVVRLKHFETKIKLATGLGVVSRHYYSHQNTVTKPNGDIYYEEYDPNWYESPKNNTTFSTYLNAYLSAGLVLNFPINRNFAFNTEFGFFHMSNGKTRVPNRGINTFYGGAGFIASVNPEEEVEPIQFPDLPYRWSLNITGSVGKMHLDREDKHKFFIATFHTGAIYNVNNWYGVGPGVDVFFNDNVNINSKNGFYCTKKLDGTEMDYTFTDKLRVGIGINNEFQFGRLTAMIDWGVYVINPSRNYYQSYNGGEVYQGKKRPVFYKCKDVGVDDGWNYIRFGLKCRVWDNIYLQALAKTHLHICEYIEFGVGYSIPFISKSKRKENVIFHNRKNWWKNY